MDPILMGIDQCSRSHNVVILYSRRSMNAQIYGHALCTKLLGGYGSLDAVSGPGPPPSISIRCYLDQASSDQAPWGRSS